ncbi:hypothetical protein [Paenibacillus sp. 2KB_22]|uniref:hypothetical protein n=1 Tax=Paenibacillus sp. 2KB_22 TaxID=3232978 RepID=UPI003F99A891
MKIINHDGNKPNALVLSIEHNPTNYVLTEKMILTDIDVPLPEPIPWMEATLYINTETNVMFYNYARPETLSELVSRMASQQNVMKSAIDDLIMGGVL